MLASIALHALPITVWWMQPPYVSTPPAVSALERVMAVRLLSTEDETVRLPPTADVKEAPVLSSFAMDERMPADPEPMPVQTIAPLFPPKEPPYIPAGELDTRPSPQTPVIIPFPDAPLDVPKVSGILVLYIGTDGAVHRVEVDESDWPPEFEKAAVETFLQARMHPGILNGRLTRARTKILVEFEQR